ncbi:MAG: response regulator [Salaquimonas sp.]
MSGTGKKFYVIDDEQALRQTIVAALNSIDLEVESFASGLAFLDAQKDLAPGCVLLDVRMPDMDGLEVLEKLCQVWIDAPVIMISGQGDIPTAVNAIRSGAVDFIEKPFRLDDLFEVVNKVRNNELSAPTASEPANLSQDIEKLLSEREREVLVLLVRGDQNKVVAKKLGISPRTVEVHRARIMQRLGLGSFAELVRVAVLSGYSEQ